MKRFSRKPRSIGSMARSLLTSIVRLRIYVALLSLIGLVNLPIIYFSVQWWNTLHQGSSVSLRGTSMHAAMLTGMLVMALAFWM